MGLSQFRQGRAKTARRTFLQLLQQYPDAEVVTSAQYYLAGAEEILGDMAAADSAYQLVFQRYPTSPRTSEALYKHAVILDNGGETDAARAAFQAVLDEYPQSDEAVLAKNRLREIKSDCQRRSCTTSGMAT